MRHSRLFIGMSSITCSLCILLLGCKMGPEAARKELGKMGVDYTGKAFGAAAENNDVTAVDLFLKAGMDPNVEIPVSSREHTTALMIGIKKKHQGIVKLLLDVSTFDKDSILLDDNFAVVRSNTEIVRMFINKDANVNIRVRGDGSWVGFTPLHAAAQRDPEIVRLLLDAGADVDIRGPRAETPLHFAADAQKPEIVRLLLDAGADVDAVGVDDRTPLIDNLLRDEDDPETVRILVEAGAFVDESLIDLARHKWHVESIPLMEDALARRLSQQSVETSGPTDPPQ